MVAYWWSRPWRRPRDQVDKPEKLWARRASLELTVETPAAALSKLDVTLEQGGKQTPLSRLRPGGAAGLTQDGAGQACGDRAISKQAVPDLKSGDATCPRGRRPSGALRPSRDGLVDGARDVRVRLEPPRVAVVVDAPLRQPRRRGDRRLSRDARRRAVGRPRRRRRLSPATPARRRWASPTPALRVAFFALLYDQDLDDADQRLRDATRPATRRARRFDSRVFPKPFRRSRIEVHRQFLQRVVPAILENTPYFKVSPTRTTWSRRSSTINRDLRKQNAATIAALAAQVRARDAVEGRLQAAWQLAGGVGASPITARTSTRARRSTSRCTLASTSPSPRQCPCVAANGGKVVLRRVSRHLRQLRHRRPRVGRAVALRAPVVYRRQARRQRSEGPAARPERHDGPGRRRPPALHDAASTAIP